MKTYLFEKLRLRHKIIIPLILVMILLFTIIIIVTISALKKTNDYNTDKLIEFKIKEVNNSIEQISNTALYIASISSEMKVVKDAYVEYYKTGDLENASKIIAKQFTGINKMILKSSGHEARIHFHLPPAISFCRCWSEVRGDDVSSFRKTILKVSKEHSFVKGIETGRGGFVIRGVAPIFSETGEYFGSVEAFFNINTLLQKIDRKADEDFAIFMNTDLLKIATNFLENTSTNIHDSKQIVNNFILVDKTDKFNIENVVKHELNLNVIGNNNFQYDNYKYAVIPLKNINNEVEGIGILQIDISTQQDAMKRIIIFEIIVFIILLIIVVFLLSNLSNRFVIKRIISTDLLLQKLSKGELIGESKVCNKDEICSMQASLNKLNRNISKNINFAIEIGKGNFNTGYQILSDTDLLGGALIRMQNNLIQYSEETKTALEKSIQSEENFKTLSNLTFEGILIHNNGVVIDVNLSFEKIFAYKLDEIIGKNIIDLLFPSSYHNIILENIRKNLVLPYEVEGIRKNGSVFPVEIEAKSFKNNEGEEFRVTAIRDISLRKKAEAEIEKLSTAVEQSANTIVITDIECNIEYVNPKFTKLTGYTAQEVLGKNPRILNAGTLERDYFVQMWKTISAGEIWEGEFHNKKKNGEYFWEQVTITPIKDNRGKITNYLAIKEDITLRKKAKKKLQKQNEEYASLNEKYKVINEELLFAKEKAEESNQLKTEFIHNMSHEIRTPMNGILGFSSLLDKPNLTLEKRNQYINIIQNSGHQLMRIIDDILEISRLGTKQVKIIESKICLNDLLLEQFSIFDIKAKENKIPLYLKKELSDKDSTILTDSTKLNKILSNLLENALKYTNEGYIELGYKLLSDTEPIQIQIYVKDTGIGIKLESLKTIFERFSQEEKELSKNVGGLGLGLSIAKENAELLGGKITVQSKKGEGSTFFITIPFKHINFGIEGSNSGNSKAVEMKKQNDFTILIVEDEEINFLYLETLLENISLNIKILHAKHGKEAVEICMINHKIDFVFMDLKMPIMSGYEATRKIKEFKPNMPIIAQTAYSTKEKKEQAFAAGCDDFISKPISEEALTEIVSKYLFVK